MLLRRRQEGKGRTPREPKRHLTDRVLIVVGFVLAAGAAFLPWYAVLGGHGLGIRNAHLRLAGHGDRGGSHNLARSFGLGDDGRAAQSAVDDISTGTIPEIGDMKVPEKAQAKAEAEQQPFPGRPFRVVHVANGQALIADAHGIYLVGVGSKLPDNSRLKEFERKDGHWVIVTSNGEFVGPSPASGP